MIVEDYNSDQNAGVLIVDEAGVARNESISEASWWENSDAESIPPLALTDSSSSVGSGRDSDSGVVE